MAPFVDVPARLPGTAYDIIKIPHLECQSFVYDLLTPAEHDTYKVSESTATVVLCYNGPNQVVQPMFRERDTEWNNFVQLARNSRLRFIADNQDPGPILSEGDAAFVSNIYLM
jgi:hypothetical protein